MAGLLDKAGVPLVHHPQEFVEYKAKAKAAENPKERDQDAIRLKVASFGSWPALVDWDADGDLDLLIGTFGGEIYRRENVGKRAKPEFAVESTALEAGDGRIKMSGHANPVVADWDGDGLWDLVVGSSVGAVVWFKNEGTAKEPRFGAAQPLVAAKSKDKFWTQYVETGQAPSPGVRAQICVTDYDGDGRLDLIVGDYSRIVTLRKLSAKERSAFDVLLREEADLMAQARPDLDPDSDEGKALSAKFDTLQEKKQGFYADPKTEGTMSSFIWLYPRAPKK